MKVLCFQGGLFAFPLPLLYTVGPREKDPKRERERKGFSLLFLFWQFSASLLFPFATRPKFFSPLRRTATATFAREIAKKVSRERKGNLALGGGGGGPEQLDIRGKENGGKKRRGDKAGWRRWPVPLCGRGERG